RGRPSARRCASEKIFTQFFTQLHQNWKFRGRKSESGRAVDSFIRKVLRSQSPSFSRSGEIGIRSRLKICRYLVSWGFKSPLRHFPIYVESNCLQTHLLLRVRSVWWQLHPIESLNHAI